jgi:dihydroorotate dehydrogenase
VTAQPGAGRSLYRHALRPLLFRLSPDRSHAAAQVALSWQAPWEALGSLAGLAVSDPRLETTFAGIKLPNPIGLAAGFDKDCDLVETLRHLGFGFVTVGSIMPEPRVGNPFPRLVRYAETESLADSMGLPSKGLAYAVARLARGERGGPPVFANVGGFTAQAIADSVLAVEPYVDAVEISLMCPNIVKDGFDALALLSDVLDRLEGRKRPAIVRVPNDTAASDERLSGLIECCVSRGIAGLKIGGGQPVAEARLGTKQGTLHGRAIHARAVANVRRAAGIAAGRIPIKANGGISSAQDVMTMLRAGAACVDLYSAFVYQGWAVAQTLNRDLLDLLGTRSVPAVTAGAE